MTDLVTCPICDTPLQLGDLFVSDIKWVPCHAECLKGSPPPAHPIQTYQWACKTWGEPWTANEWPHLVEFASRLNGKQTKRLKDKEMKTASDFMTVYLTVSFDAAETESDGRARINEEVSFSLGCSLGDREETEDMLRRLADAVHEGQSYGWLQENIMQARIGAGELRELTMDEQNQSTVTNEGDAAAPSYRNPKYPTIEEIRRRLPGLSDIAGLDDYQGLVLLQSRLEEICRHVKARLRVYTVSRSTVAEAGADND